MSVYTVRNVRHLALMLVEVGAIQRWPAGLRRLSTIEDGVEREFRKVHGKFHTDP